MFDPRLSTLTAILSVGLLAGCASSPAPSTMASSFTAGTIDTEAFAPKVDAFAVILDVSSSMKDQYQGTPKFHIAKDMVSSFNQTTPEMGYNGGLVAFGKGRCTGSGGANLVYGVTQYSSSGFAAGLDSLGCAGGITPMGEGVDVTTAALSGESGPVAVVLVSDFWDIDVRRAVLAINKLKAQLGSNLCLHTVKVGDAKKAPAVIAAMTNAAGCSSSVDAASLASSGAMAGYVADVLLSPISYKKHTVSATTLFDFDKSVLKPAGKAALHELDESIKSQGMRVVDINVVGHTDSIGTEAYNQGLSDRRAMSVKHYMVSEGIDGSIIDASGRGESDPVASNATAEGRAQNRRVDIHVGTKQAMH